MSYADHVAADRRLAILEHLIAEGGASSETALLAALRAQGHRVGLTRDDIRDLLKDLRAADLVEIEYYRDTLMVASITARGVDAAQGVIMVDSVAAPPMGRR